MMRHLRHVLYERKATRHDISARKSAVDRVRPLPRSLAARTVSGGVVVLPASVPSSISARQLHLNELLGGCNVELASLPDWTPGSPFPTPTQSLPADTTVTPDYTFKMTAWTIGGATYSATETDWSSDTRQATVSGAAWSYTETATAHYTIQTSGGAAPINASGSLTCTLNADGGTWGSQYNFTVTATATAGGQLPSPAGGGAGGGGGGTWTQTTTNSDSIDAGTALGSGKTTSSFTYNRPYSSGTSAQPVTGTQKQTTADQVSYSYQAERAAAARSNRAAASAPPTRAAAAEAGHPPGLARRGAKANTAAQAAPSTTRTISATATEIGR